MLRGVNKLDLRKVEGSWSMEWIGMQCGMQDCYENELVMKSNHSRIEYKIDWLTELLPD